MGNKQGQILRVFVIVVTAAPATDLTGGEAGKTKMIRRSSSGDTNVRHTEVQYGRRDERELRSWIGRGVLMSPRERFFLFFLHFFEFFAEPTRTSRSQNNKYFSVVDAHCRLLKL
jgi:hypothetical protein